MIAKKALPVLGEEAGLLSQGMSLSQPALHWGSSFSVYVCATQH